MINRVKTIFNYLQGWKTNQKVVVIESDDWGAIRIPNRSSQRILFDRYPANFRSPYYLYDTIASSEDLSMLFEVLNSVKDKHNKPAVLTANVIMANPDFEKIKGDHFTKYHREKFTTTLRNYYSQDPFSTWKEGIRNSVFYPQLHGMEHVDIHRWMDQLLSKNELYLNAFSHSVYAVDSELNGVKKNFTAALDYRSELEAEEKATNLIEACQIFKETFGYQPQSFIAPSYTWSSNYEKVLWENGVRYLQGIVNQKKPNLKSQKQYSLVRHYFGQQNSFGQRYLIRNIFFEPALSNKSIKQVVNEVIKRIKLSFSISKPAVISSHRLNYVGSLNERNRDTNLKALKALLHYITNEWPDVIFMTSSQLGGLIDKDYD